MKLVRWFKRAFGPHIVVVSEPYSDGNGWSYILGDEYRFRFRKLQSAEAAYDSYSAMLTGLRLGSPEMSIKLVKLNVEQAQALVRAEVSYYTMLEPHL
jgi:hypothetical protein